MTPTDPLAELRRLHLPEPIGFWPPALGWWALAGFVVVAVVVAAFVVVRRRRSLGRHALREVSRVASAGADVQDTAAALSELMRRVAIQRFGAERVAALHGEEWQWFLVDSGPPRRRRAIDADAGRLLALAAYAPPKTVELRCEGFTLDRDEFVDAVRRWIRWNT